MCKFQNYQSRNGFSSLSELQHADAKMYVGVDCGLCAHVAGHCGNHRETFYNRGDVLRAVSRDESVWQGTEGARTWNNGSPEREGLNLIACPTLRIWNILDFYAQKLFCAVLGKLGSLMACPLESGLQLHQFPRLHSIINRKVLKNDT